MRATLLVTAIVLCLVLLPTIGSAQAPVTGDTYVVSSSPDTNYGSGSLLALQSSGVYTLIQFDLTRLPAGITPAQVTHATAKLFVTAVTTKGNFDVCLVTSSWAEKDVTFHTLPTYGSCTLGGSVVKASKSQYIEVDLTTFVQDWLSGTPNNGILLKPSSGSLISASFEAKESTATSHDAELDAGVTGPTGPQGPTGATGATGPIGPAGPKGARCNRCARSAG